MADDEGGDRRQWRGKSSDLKDLMKDTSLAEVIEDMQRKTPKASSSGESPKPSKSPTFDHKQKSSELRAKLTVDDEPVTPSDVDLDDMRAERVATGMIRGKSVELKQMAVTRVDGSGEADESMTDLIRDIDPSESMETQKKVHFAPSPKEITIDDEAATPSSVRITRDSEDSEVTHMRGKSSELKNLVVGSSVESIVQRMEDDAFWDSVNPQPSTDSMISGRMDSTLSFTDTPPPAKGELLRGTTGELEELVRGEDIPESLAVMVEDIKQDEPSDD